jgi:hypothetical protein
VAAWQAGSGSAGIEGDCEGQAPILGPLGEQSKVPAPGQGALEEVEGILPGAQGFLQVLVGLLGVLERGRETRGYWAGGQ